MAGDHTYTAGEEPTAANLNEWIRDQVITICTSATRPSSGGPVEGRTIWETDTNRFKVFDGTNWVDLPVVFVDATAPTNKLTGTLHFDTDDDTARVWNGSAWKGTTPSVLAGASTNSLSAGSTNYVGVSSVSATETAVSFPVPFACTISKLHVSVSTAPTAGKSWAFTVRKNAADTAVTCSVADAAIAGSDTSNSVAFAAGDLFAIESTPTGTPTAGTMTWAVRVTL